jgi:hypothetical protein
MKLFFPENIFSRILINQLDEEFKSEIVFNPSVNITSLVKKNKTIGLIPTMDLVTNKDLFVSKDVGISFEGLLSNSYIYYSNRPDINEIKIAGDVSTVEIILSKILFRELYKKDISINILTKLPPQSNNENMITVGDDNFRDDRINNAISFAEEVVEIISAPFVNFILVSPDSDLLKEYAEKMKTSLNNGKQKSSKVNFDFASASFIQNNLDKVFFSFTEQDVEGINQLIRLPFYYGILKDIIEAKFV